MITFGVDAHKQVHMVVAVNELGVLQGTWRGANTPQRGYNAESSGHKALRA